MFKRKSEAPTVSPLAPPPASTHGQYNHQPPPFQRGPPPSQQQMQQNQRGSRGSMGPPLSSPNDLSRVGTNGTMNGSVSSKGEKRRSGFFGLGGKKDKEKVKEDKHERPSGRSSFSNDRNASQPIPPQKQGRPEPNFIPPDMADRYPRPQSSHTPPLGFYQNGQHRESSPLGASGGQGGFNQFSHQDQFAQGQQRNVSSPQQRPVNDSAQTMPKSQSMGFQRQNVPETHPYRGYLNSQQDQGASSPSEQDERSSHSGQRGQGAQGGQNGSMPRSNTMPLNQMQKSSPVRSPPPIEKETMSGSPSLSNIGEGVGGVGAPNQPWMRQFEVIVELIAAQPQKTYVASPPELEMILARTSAGGQPKQGQPGSVANDWDSVWLQLSGISLSMWSMKETRAAAAKGDKVPPTYFNITDSSLELLAPLPPPPHRPNSHPHHFVFSLNTAGSNRLLFSCPSERDIAKWATGLRLAAWERARLEEIYTGHLIKAGGREPKSELHKGKMEGWVRVRVMGGTDWKRLWAVLHTPNAPEEKEDEKKSRRRSIFGFGEKEKEVIQEPNTGISMASFYTEPRTVKNKTTPAALTITAVTQAYAVFPERLEVMSQSNLLKVVGKVGGDLLTIEGRMRDSGWALIMPETPEETSPPPPTPLVNMMKWVTGFHDVFEMYGRPQKYNWNPHDPQSLFFAYPQGPNRNRLFIDLEDALQADFRLANLPAVRTQFCEIVQRRMAKPADQYRAEDERETDEHPPLRRDGSYRLPPLQFGDASPAHSHDSQPRSLTPITERTDIASRTNSTRTAGSTFFMSDRKVSGETPLKQGSGGSNKHTQGGSGDDRLAPISDSTETFGQYTDEPVSHGNASGPPPRSAGHSPSPSTWSQASEDTPKLSAKDSSAEPTYAPQMATVDSVPDQSRSVYDRNLPSRTVHDAANISSSNQSPSKSVVVATPFGMSAEQEQAVHAPTPRRGPADPIVALGASPLQDEPAAMYLMNMEDEPPVMSPTQSQFSQLTPQAPVSSRAIQSTGRPTVQPAKIQSPPLANAPLTAPDISHLAISADPTPANVSPERPRIITNFDAPRSTHDALGRKPSGARALPPKKASPGPRLDSISDTPSIPMETATSQGSYMSTGDADLASPIAAPSEEKATHPRLPSSATQADLGEDAAHFISYADIPSPAKKPLPPIEALSPPLKAEEELRSSFAPSRAAEERRAKAEQATRDQQRAMNVPGGGKRTQSGLLSRPQGGTWSDDEDEDEEEKDDDASPEIVKRSLPPQGGPSGRAPQRGMSQTRALPPVPRPNGEYEHERQPSSGAREQSRPREPQQQERPRDVSMYSAGPGVASEYPRSNSPAAPHRNAPQSQLPQSAPQPPSARQTLWNANFSADHGMDQPKSGKFVDLDEPSAQLTKAFAPHGLLQAGMQDKEDRSAKKQEELAREMGSSLINVPSKPPPPQTGLLGAVAAHERDRKNAGGIGATLTDREREKRFAEDRQREIEKLQRQQMDHMSRYGGEMPQQGQAYSQYGGYGMPPMSMMGMPPSMGYNPYQQGAYNPYAQQQAMMAAQMAYQHAMMMSQAGSQAGGPASQHPGTNGRQSPDRPASPATMQGQGGMSQSPSMGNFGNYYAPPQPNFAQWGGMPGMQGMQGMQGMPWSPSPPPMMGGSGWLQPPSMHGGMGGSQDGGEPRSRGHSMYSEGGDRERHQPAS